MATQAPSISRYKPLVNLIAAIALSLLIIASSGTAAMSRTRGLVLEASAYLYVPIQWVKTIFTIEKDYRELQQRHIKAQIDLNKSRTLLKENQRLRSMLGFKGDRKFNVIPANVLSDVGSHTMNSLTVDQGSEDGVTLLSGVVDAQAQLVGKVVAISANTALVQLVSDKNFRVSVREMRSRDVGILSYSLKTGYVIQDVPKNAEVIAGDSVVTSGFSDIFPEHIFVGWVSTISPVVEDYVKSVRVDLAADFNRIEEVFILK
ncbi:MAG: rod shape-determining protein MreC [Candidatus Marinimicrobia bacterium]|nr:rod shape-determining protein MreC [FCB group bacterium]MBL7026091.1 rod shape-determining protein MreC [Candidatus Neomarinimicrobiota bacterium]